MRRSKGRSRSGQVPEKRMPVPSALWSRIAPRLLVPALLAALVFPAAQWVFPTPASVGDAYGYLMTAQRIVDDGYFAYGHDPPGSDLPPNAKVTPGWPVALAAVLALPGGDSSDPAAWARSARIPIMILMCLFTVGIVLASTLSARVLAGDGAGLLAGYLSLLYMPFYWAGGVTLAEHMGAFVLAWALYMGVRLSSREQRRTELSAAALGVLCGVIVMVRPNLSLWVFVPIVYVALMRLEPPVRLARLAAAGVLGFMLIMAPWWVRNAMLTGRFIPVKSNYVAAQPAANEQGNAEGNGAEGADADSAPAEEPDSPAAAVPSSWESTDLGLVLLRASVPWMPFFDVEWEETNRPDAVRIEYPERPVAPVAFANFLTGLMIVYHRAILLFALVSLFYIRRLPQLMILLGSPIAMLFVHWSHLTIRYVYPPMVAVVLMAAIGVWSVWRSLGARDPSLGYDT